MARPAKPNPPYDTTSKRLERLEYLMARLCETLKIEYNLQ